MRIFYIVDEIIFYLNVCISALLLYDVFASQSPTIHAYVCISALLPCAEFPTRKGACAFVSLIYGNRTELAQGRPR
jgi:hypothetical protein